MAERLALAQGTFNGCFGCGPDNPVGLKLVFEKDGDEVVSRFLVGRSYSGYREFAHGGVVATLLDEAMGWAMLHVAGRHGVTKTLTVTYRRPVTVERPMLLRARVIADAGSSVILESVIEDHRGRVLARAEGEWAVVREDRAAG